MTPRSLRVLALALSALALTATAGTAMGGFTGSITGVTGNVSSGTLVLSDSVAGGTGPCTSAPGNVPSLTAVSCPDGALPTGTLPTTGSVSKTVTLTNSSSLTAVKPQVSLSSCGVQSVVDSRPAANAGIIHNTVTYGVAGALPGGTGMGFSQPAKTYIATVKAYVQPQTFSIVAWFKFSNAADTGTIIGFTDSYTDTGQGNWDRHLFLNGGKLSWGVYPGSTQLVTSGTLTPNVWHQAVASIGSNGQRLYVDGALVASNAANTTAQVFTGYWHLGFGGEAQGWGLPASFNAYWPGSLQNIAVIPGQLTAAQVTTLYSQTTNAAEVTAINALTPTNFWQLNDTASQVFNGGIPGVSGSPLVDLTGGGNSALVTGGVSVAQPGPLSGFAANFDGSSGYLQTTTQYTNPTPLTVTAYFNTSVSYGTIFEFANTQAQGPATWDRHVWIDSAGHLVWGVYPNAVKEVVSPGTYADGQWHQVTVTVGPGGTGIHTGMNLFVDGTWVAGDPTVTAPQVFNGYWHIGWGNETNGWTDPPTNPYWNGSIAHVAVFPAQLTDAQIAALHTPTSTSTIESAILALTPTAYWPLQDLYATSGVCSNVLASAQYTQGATTTCAYPAGAGACPAPTLSLAGLATGASLATGTTQTVTVALTQGATSASLSGTHLYTTLSFSLNDGGFSAVLSHLSGTINQ